MSILIANLGTSDLAVQIEGYYFPIQFNRDEPNIILPPPGSNEEALWNQREAFIQEFLCEELKLEKSTSFRDLTQKILQQYKENPDYWHQRLRPGRIWGVITTAYQKFQVKEIYCFVTNQPPEEVQGYRTDTINLFEILKIWLEKEMPDITLHLQEIKLKAIDQDALFNYYYEFFSKVSPKVDKIFISIKGGTGQMQTALRIQSLATMVEFQANLEPELNIIKVLNGEASSCKLNAYWQYIRSQKYQAIIKLLQRWDFDGSIQLLQDFQRYLDTLIKENITDDGVSNNSVKIKQIIAALNIAVDCFNLDNVKASQDLKKPQSEAFRKELFQLIADNNYDRLLNLYTQCRIYWKLNQIANFLARLASFNEETLHYLIPELGGLKYFHKTKYSDNWDLKKDRVEPDLWKHFEDKEGRKCNDRYPYRLPGRFSKLNFVNALIQYRDNSKEKIAWQKISESLNKLNYWVEKRNQIIHSAKGVSLESMDKSLRTDRKNSYPDESFAGSACLPNEILAEMTNISNQTSQMLKQGGNKFVGLNQPYYIYSEICDWVVHQLIEDGL